MNEASPRSVRNPRPRAGDFAFFGFIPIEDISTSAQAADAYLLADRGSWISFKNKGALGIAVEGDNRLFNQYGIILVNPARHPHVQKEFGQAFIDWLISPPGQSAIDDYKIGGQQLFFANAHAPGA